MARLFGHAFAEERPPDVPPTRPPPDVPSDREIEWARQRAAALERQARELDIEVNWEARR